MLAVRSIVELKVVVVVVVVVDVIVVVSRVVDCTPQ